jgi:hypothetical protein
MRKSLMRRLARSGPVVAGLAAVGLAAMVTAFADAASAAPIIDDAPGDASRDTPGDTSGGPTGALVLFKFDVVAVGNPATAQVVFNGGTASIGSAPAQIGGPVAVGSWGTFTGAAFAPTNGCCTNGPPPPPPPATIPLPGTAWLVIGGLAALLGCRGGARRTRRPTRIA